MPTHENQIHSISTTFPSHTKWSNTRFNHASMLEARLHHFHNIPQSHQVIKQSVQSCQHMKMKYIACLQHSPVIPGDRTISSIMPSHENQIHSISTTFPSHTRWSNSQLHSISTTFRSHTKWSNTRFNHASMLEWRLHHFHNIPQSHQVIEQSVQSCQHMKIKYIAFLQHSPVTPSDRTLGSIMPVC